MANVFLNLPTTAANGAGTAIDVSSMGATKTIVYAPTDSTVGQPFITIEISNDTAGNEWSELYQFKAPGEYTVNVACHRMRATTSNYRAGSAAAVDVGASDDGALFAELVAPAGNGNGAAVDVSALGILKTIQVTDSFLGTLNIEVSEDGGTSWAEIASFVNAGGIKTLVIASEFMRVKRANVPTVNPGLPTIWIGGADLGGHEDGGVAISAGTQSVSTGTIVLSNSNGISFGLSGSSRLTASYGGGNLTVSAGTQSMNTGSLVFSNSNGFDIGMSGSTAITQRVASVIATGAENALVTGNSNISAMADRSILVSAGQSGNISLIAGATSDSEGMLISAAQNISVTGGRLDMLVTGNDGALIRADNTATAKGITLSAASGSVLGIASNVSLSASASMNIRGVDHVSIHGDQTIYAHASYLRLQSADNASIRFFGTDGGQSMVTITGASTNATLVLDNLLAALNSLGLISKSTT